MILPHRKDALHKAWLFRLLTSLIDDDLISQAVYFKGGTCAAMLGWLDRFSIDLDFDLRLGVDSQSLRPRLKQIFKTLGLEIKDGSQQALQFFLKYPAPKNQRNTLKLEIVTQALEVDVHEAQQLIEINRLMICQTKTTMFSHKLVALTDRFKKHGSIAGRDVYDIHSFLLQGFDYIPEIIQARTGQSAQEYLKSLISFIDKKVTQKIITQDLNVLLPAQKLKQLRNKLKPEVLMFLKSELTKT